MRRASWAIVILALALRVIYGLAQDVNAPYARGNGDSWWYLVNGDALVTGRMPSDNKVELSRLPTPPGYLLLLGLAQAVTPGTGAIVIVRIVQACMGVVIVVCCGRIAWRLTRRPGAALLTMLLLAISPAMIIETAQIASETLYMTLLAVGLAAYIETIEGKEEKRLTGDSENQRKSGWRVVVAGVAFGLAALTRAPILLFPVGLVIHLLIFYGLRRGGRAIVVLLTVYALTVGTGTVYSLARWNRFVIAGEGFAAFVYVGAIGWESPEQVDASLGSTQGGADPADFMAAAGATIGADPIGYVGRRIGELVNASLQPHGTAYFPGRSLRELAGAWLRDDRTLTGLLTLMQSDSFAPKLALYIFQYGGAILAAIGIWRARRQRRIVLVLVGFIAYTLLVHLLLLALPRYIFPTVLALAPLASAALFPPRDDG